LKAQDDTCTEKNNFRTEEFHFEKLRCEAKNNIGERKKKIDTVREYGKVVEDLINCARTRAQVAGDSREGEGASQRVGRMRSPKSGRGREPNLGGSARNSKQGGKISWGVVVYSAFNKKNYGHRAKAPSCELGGKKGWRGSGSNLHRRQES